MKILEISEFAPFIIYNAIKSTEFEYLNDKVVCKITTYRKSKVIITESSFGNDFTMITVAKSIAHSLAFIELSKYLEEIQWEETDEWKHLKLRAKSPTNRIEFLQDLEDDEACKSDLKAFIIKKFNEYYGIKQ